MQRVHSRTFSIYWTGCVKKISPYHSPKNILAYEGAHSRSLELHVEGVFKKKNILVYNLLCVFIQSISLIHLFIYLSPALIQVPQCIYLFLSTLGSSLCICTIYSVGLPFSLCLVTVFLLSRQAVHLHPRAVYTAVMHQVRMMHSMVERIARTSRVKPVRSKLVCNRATSGSCLGGESHHWSEMRFRIEHISQQVITLVFLLLYTTLSDGGYILVRFIVSGDLCFLSIYW